MNGAGKRIADPLVGGDFFGEMSLLTSEPRTSTIRAIGDTRVIRIDKFTFADILSQKNQIVESLGKVLTDRQKELEAESQQVVSEKVQTLRFITQIQRFLGLPSA